MKSNLLFFAIIISVSLTVTSCSEDWFGVNGEGPIETEQRPETGFNNIELDIAANVEIVNDSAFSVEVSDHENLVPHISTTVKGGTLIIRHDPKNFHVRNSEALIRIAMPALQALEINGSGNISVNSGFEGLNSISVSGSGEVVVDEPFITESLDMDISGSGKITVNGQADRLSISISGSGNIYGYGLEAQNAECEISGSGDAYLNVVKSLDARISGSGNINYTGQPSISVHISGSGKVISR